MPARASSAGAAAPRPSTSPPCASRSTAGWPRPKPTIEDIVDRIGPLANSAPTVGDAPRQARAEPDPRRPRASARGGHAGDLGEQPSLGAGLRAGHRALGSHLHRRPRRATIPSAISTPTAVVPARPIPAPQCTITPSPAPERADDRRRAIVRNASEVGRVEVGDRVPPGRDATARVTRDREPGHVLRVPVVELVGLVQTDDRPTPTPLHARPPGSGPTRCLPQSHSRPETVGQRDLVDATVERSVARPAVRHPGASASSACQSTTPGPSSDSGWMHTWSAPRRSGPAPAPGPRRPRPTGRARRRTDRPASRSRPG